MLGQRLDKWLWCARLVKTRSGAARLISAGKVRVNGERALKPSSFVHRGDVVTAIQLGRLSVARVISAAARRGPPSLGRSLYEDLTPAMVAPPGDGNRSITGRHGPRPTKRDRRRLDALREGPDF